MPAPANPLRPQLEVLEGREVPTLLFGLTAANRLISFDPVRPAAILTSLPITGLLNRANGEVMTDIDMRPGTGLLYGRSNFGRLYLVNTLSGFSQAVGSPVVNNSFYSGFATDPTADRMRVVGNNTTNLLINPTFGSLIVAQSPLTYRAGDVAQGLAPRVTGLAYTNTVPFANATVLYGIDHLRNTVVQIGNRTDNQGLTRTIGSLGFDVTARVGFDINPLTGLGYAVFQRPGQTFSGFYFVNVLTGRATQIGFFGPNRVLNDIAVDLRNVTATTPFAAPQSTTFFSPIFSSATTIGSTTTGLFPTTNSGNGQ